ncbi:hypothetical protein O6072_20130 [Mycolicibacterium neoaurum]|uniref:hypothetical protein n=1 Tax=Mycolicibacterium neoaurum TaxID=1795 RepID=UPI00248AF72A|nr:hypothetical protein [Mycolicibacterium neoaurum]WBP94015.1 hypothetical protein O7W24_23275 [Mycolicibacterium neoaurum]WBS07153.1 hypothetical protein O6072_20130 [Mycolicibacterium neoaurum]
MMGNQPFDDDDEVDTEDGVDIGGGLAAFDDIFEVPAPHPDPELDAFGVDFGAPEQSVGEPLFTVTNPPGTVTVSAMLDGRIHRIELSPEATTEADSEAQLAAEIVVIADLANQQARSAQFSYVLEGMQDHGHDAADTREFLTRSVGLPSPEQADAARAQIFATRYAGEHE